MAAQRLTVQHTWKVLPVMIILPPSVNRGLLKGRLQRSDESSLEPDMVTWVCEATGSSPASPSASKAVS